MTFIETDILKPNDRKVREESYDTLLDYLKVYHVNGFKTACDIEVDGKKIKLDDYDMELKEDQLITLVFRPAIAEAVGLSGFWGFVVNLLASASVSYVIGKIFAPSLPEQISTNSNRNNGRSSSTYDLNSQQNEAKRGSAIPIIYGKVRTYPALIAPPYRRYENNEEYLYQLMCIGQGKYNIDNVMVSDTDSKEIQAGNFRHEILEYDDFKVSDGIKTKVGDTNYNELVKTIPDVENLELRGAPASQYMLMKFSGSTIEFSPFLNGDEPDLTSLVNGSTIKITETVSNNGTYTVDFVTNNIVTVQSHTFTTEPTQSTYNLPEDGANAVMCAFGDTLTEEMFTGSPYVPDWYTELNINDVLEIDFEGEKRGIVKSLVYDGTNYSIIFYDSIFQTDNTDCPIAYTGTMERNYMGASAEFTTSYGAYILKNPFDNQVEEIEIDYIHPNGVYDTDASSNFIDRTVSFKVFVSRLEAFVTPGGIVWKKIVKHTETISTTAKDNSPIRVSWKWDVTSDIGAGQDIYINFLRVTTEPADITSMDKTYIRSVKAIHEPPNDEPLGDITLVWAKIKASNAISSIGQFAINAWVTRKDIANDINSVITDLYTNTIYGGRLPSSDLVLPVTTETVNGTFDDKLTLFDAMSTVAKSNKYSVFTQGSEIKLKQDAVKPIVTALYNETNILKDSLKISYLFEEESETDSVKVLYRSADDFSEQFAIYPTDGDFPSTTELWGCTDTTIAESMAKYLYKQYKARRKSLEFKTDVQGHIPQFLDRIAISHRLPSWGFASEVTSVAGSEITLNDDIDVNYDKIIFIQDNGSVSDILSFTKAGDDLTVTDLPSWVHAVNNNDATRCSVGTTTDIVKDYIVASIKPSGNTVTVQCTNYDEGIYS